MIIGGLQKFTLIDFPGKMAAAVFTRGCNFRCPYCHNPELVEQTFAAPSVTEEELFAFLETRKDRLEGVVVTGGEPTLQADLASFLKKIKDAGLAVKLDTNGSSPAVLGGLLEKKLVDYVAMDIKGSPRGYSRAAGVSMSLESIRASIRLIITSGIPHELRMTYTEKLVPVEDLPGVAELARGCRLFVVQPFLPTKTLDPRMLKEPRPSGEKLEEVRSRLQDLGLPAVVR